MKSYTISITTDVDLTLVLSAIAGAMDVVKPQEIFVKDATQGVELLSALTRMQTTEEHLIEEAIRDFGMKTTEDIAEHVRNGSVDMEWYESQAEVLDTVIGMARGSVEEDLEAKIAVRLAQKLEAEDPALGM